MEVILVNGAGRGCSGGRFFDELTKGLASGAISWRRALKLTGAAILGSTGLLAVFPGVAGAQTVVGETRPTVVLAGVPECESHQQQKV